MRQERAYISFTQAMVREIREAAEEQGFGTAPQYLVWLHRQSQRKNGGEVAKSIAKDSTL